MLFGKEALMSSLRPYKLSVCADTLPSATNQFQRWETGTLNFEGLAGIDAVIQYIASLATRYGNLQEDQSLRQKIVAGYKVIHEHESKLTRKFLQGVAGIPGLKIYGIKDPESTKNDKRTPTFAIRMDCLKTAGELADLLLKDYKIISGSGHFYAKYFAEGLGLMPTGGYVRIGFAHYNSCQEIDRVVDALAAIAKAHQ